MTALIPVRTLQPLVVCPATDDGMACAVVLNRVLKDVRTTIFLPEFSPGDIFAYPVLTNSLKETHLHLAGFAYQDGLDAHLRTDGPATTTWYTHHYWPEEAFDRVARTGTVLHAQPVRSDTASLLIDVLGVEDEIAREAAASLASGIEPPDDVWRNWFHVSLAVRRDLYGIRHAFAPLYEGEGGGPERRRGRRGEGPFRRFRRRDQTISIFEFSIARVKQTACVVALPAARFPYMRNLCGLVFRHLGHAFVMVLVDGGDQVVMVGNRETSGWPTAENLAAAVDRALGEPRARLFDRHIVVVERGADDPVKLVEKLAAKFGRDGLETAAV
ncbi:MAG: hypothetical protein M5R36_21035 [Deltaproteobacteria bacterium]|nr:hypothetical protein [Deltaproteobacteria bacterium]